VSLNACMLANDDSTVRYTNCRGAVLGELDVRAGGTIAIEIAIEISHRESRVISTSYPVDGRRDHGRNGAIHQGAIEFVMRGRWRVGVSALRVEGGSSVSCLAVAVV